MAESKWHYKLSLLFATMRLHVPQMGKNGAPDIYLCKCGHFSGTWVEYLKHIKQLPEVLSLVEHT